jgi:hypothetical protein
MHKLQKYHKSFIAGWNTETLSPKVLKFHNSKGVQIFRILGLICIFLMVTKLNLKLPSPLFYLSIINSIFFILYNFWLIIYRWYYLCILKKKGHFDVRNSPLDHFATFIKLVGAMSKTGVKTAAGAGVTFTLAAGMYYLLVASG